MTANIASKFETTYGSETSHLSITPVVQKMIEPWSRGNLLKRAKNNFEAMCTMCCSYSLKMNFTHWQQCFPPMFPIRRKQRNNVFATKIIVGKRFNTRESILVSSAAFPKVGKPGNIDETLQIENVSRQCSLIRTNSEKMFSQQKSLLGNVFNTQESNLVSSAKRKKRDERQKIQSNLSSRI